jgi:hypothetical protein
MEQPPDVTTVPADLTRFERVGQFAARAGGLRPADPNVRRGLYAGIAIVLVLGVVLALLSALERFPEIEWRFRPGWIAITVASFTIYLFAAAEIWRRLLHRLGPELRARPARAIWFTSALGRYVPTALLMPVMRMAMAEREGAAKRVTLVSVIYEIALLLTGALVVGAYFIIDLPDLAGETTRYAVLAVPVLAIVGLHPAIFHRLTDRVLDRFGRAPLPASLGLWALLRFLALYCGIYLLAGVGLYGICESVYPATAAADLVTVIGAFAVGTAASLLAFVFPGGLVAREAATAVALSPVMPTAPAIAAAVLVRILQIGLEVVFAVITQARVRRG